MMTHFAIQISIFICRCNDSLYDIESSNLFCDNTVLTGELNVLSIGHNRNIGFGTEKSSNLRYWWPVESLSAFLPQIFGRMVANYKCYFVTL